MHDHSDHATVYSYLNNAGPVRFTHFEAKPFTITRPPTAAGSFRVSPGRIERHSVQNLGDTPSDFLRVELKHVPLRSFNGATHVEAPHTPLQPARTTDFTNAAVSVRRLICTSAPAAPPGTNPCLIESSTCGSLLIALSLLTLARAAAPVPLTTPELLTQGAVR